MGRKKKRSRAPLASQPSLSVPGSGSHESVPLGATLGDVLGAALPRTAPAGAVQAPSSKNSGGKSDVPPAQEASEAVSASGGARRRAAAAARSAPGRGTAAPPAVLAPPRVGGLPVEADAAPVPLSETDREALEMAFMGVRPLGDRARVPVASRTSSRRTGELTAGADGREEAAHARLDALVSGGLRFHVEREPDGWVRGVREGVPERVGRELGRRSAAPRALLDLHGQTGEQARQSVTRFVRAQHRLGLRTLCLVHGKGQHSEGGVGVLGDVVLEVLTEGGAAPLVQAFVSAPAAAGGTGALLVQLGD